MTFNEVFRYIMILVVVATFLLSFRYVDLGRFTPFRGVVLSLGLVVMGVLFNGAAYLFGERHWSSLLSFLMFSEETIWYGSTFAAVGYGLLMFSVARLLAAKKEDEESLEK